jgi:hypothetical protein
MLIIFIMEGLVVSTVTYSNYFNKDFNMTLKKKKFFLFNEKWNNFSVGL